MAQTLEDRLADVLNMVLSGERPDEADLAGLGKPLRRSIKRLNERVGAGKVTFDLNRIEDCQKILLDYARYDFSKSAEITPARDELDALALTINIAGEELQIAEKQVDIHKALQVSMTEKDALFREVHHRVKNNMQLITSLLSLQANKVQDERLEEEFKYTQYRIRSMAMVHEMLYGTGKLASVNYEQYLQELIGTLVVSMKGYINNIETHLDASGIQLNVDTAIPLGLLINELLTNSLMHAFPGDSGGQISVAIKKLPDHYELKLSDNGIGFPVDFDFQNNTSLGLGLVDTLTLQLDGTLHRETNNGTTYLITFKQIESNG
jgi:two-component sensor histidine kinase